MPPKLTPRARIPGQTPAASSGVKSVGGFSHLQPKRGGFSYLSDPGAENQPSYSAEDAMPAQTPVTSVSDQAASAVSGFAHLQPRRGGFSYLSDPVKNHPSVNNSGDGIAPDAMFLNPVHQSALPKAAPPPKRREVEMTPKRVDDSDDVRLSALTPPAPKSASKPTRVLDGETPEIDKAPDSYENSEAGEQTSKRSSGEKKAAPTVPALPSNWLGDSGRKSASVRGSDHRPSAGRPSLTPQITPRPSRPSSVANTNLPLNSGNRSSTGRNPSSSPVTPRPSRGPTPLSDAATNVADFVTLLLRNTLIALIVFGLLVAMILIGMPVWIDLKYEPHAQLLFPHVPLITELQATYRVPWASQTDPKQMECLGYRVFAAMHADIDKKVAKLSHVPGWANSTDANKQTATAYIFAWHRARLYARSRDAKWWQIFLQHPLRDFWQFGLNREGPSIFSVDSPWWTLPARLWDACICLRSDDELPCPSAGYFFEKYHLVATTEQDYWYSLLTALATHNQELLREDQNCARRLLLEEK